jgi:hypothetical protein
MLLSMQYTPLRATAKVFFVKLDIRLITIGLQFLCHWRWAFDVTRYPRLFQCAVITGKVGSRVGPGSWSGIGRCRSEVCEQ